MSDTARPNQNQMIVYALAAIVVLLVAIVVVMVVRDNKAATPVAVAPAVTAPVTTDPTAQTPITPSAAPGGITLAVAAGFDAAKATAVPKGTEPKAFVEGYYKAVEAKDYASALKLLPTETQAGQSADDLKGQLESYNITGWTFVSEDTKGDLKQVNVDQATSFGTISTGWLFKKSGDTWALATKKVTGMK